MWLAAVFAVHSVVDVDTAVAACLVLAAQLVLLVVAVTSDVVVAGVVGPAAAAYSVVVAPGFVAAKDHVGVVADSAPAAALPDVAPVSVVVVLAAAVAASDPVAEVKHLILVRRAVRHVLLRHFLFLRTASLHLSIRGAVNDSPQAELCASLRPRPHVP